MAAQTRGAKPPSKKAQSPIKEIQPTQKQFMSVKALTNCFKQKNIGERWEMGKMGKRRKMGEKKEVIDDGVVEGCKGTMDNG